MANKDQNQDSFLIQPIDMSEKMCDNALFLYEKLGINVAFEVVKAVKEVAEKEVIS